MTISELAAILGNTPIHGLQSRHHILLLAAKSNVAYQVLVDYQLLDFSSAF